MAKANKAIISIDPKRRGKKPPLINVQQRVADMVDDHRKKKIHFSFELLDLNHELFNLGGTCSSWANDYHYTISEISKISRTDLYSGKYDKRFRPHDFEWDKLDHRFPFGDLDYLECCQISIGKSKGRIHGFFVDHVFYPVWLDPHHNLYPDQKYGGIKRFRVPETCCAYRDEELERLDKEYKELWALLEEKTETAE